MTTKNCTLTPRECVYGGKSRRASKAGRQGQAPEAGSAKPGGPPRPAEGGCRADAGWPPRRPWAATAPSPRAATSAGRPAWAGPAGAGGGGGGGAGQRHREGEATATTAQWPRGRGWPPAHADDHGTRVTWRRPGEAAACGARGGVRGKRRRAGEAAAAHGRGGGARTKDYLRGRRRSLETPRRASNMRRARRQDLWRRGRPVSCHIHSSVESSRRHGLWRRPPGFKCRKRMARGLFVNIFREKGKKAKKCGACMAWAGEHTSSRCQLVIDLNLYYKDPRQLKVTSTSNIPRTPHSLVRLSGR